MADEGTDVSNIEQLSFCTRSVDDDLNVSEDFMGFYELKNIKNETIVNAIKDILLRSHLSLENCCGQTYDGASNMMGKRSGVSTQISAEQPKAMTTHCQGHSLSLAIKSLTKDCTILRNTLVTVGEICVLVKYSQKREKCWETLWRISRVSLRSNQKPIIQVNWINYVLQDGPSEASVLKRFWIIMNPYCNYGKNR